ncbi:hypothetical protein GQ44DRAFT_716349 [Phaeosphaeriaceae sp. PMI808]|nr:hypothetical protein GQ44DRAFT_716349 [Phaeosphaeriaceae sp. PMI808]
MQSAIWLVLVFSFDYGKLKANIPYNILTSRWPPKLLYMSQIIFKLTTPLCKLSLCFLYHTICSTSTGRLMHRTRLAIWCTIVLIVGIYLSALLVSIFQCTPIRKIWDPKIAGVCVDLTQFRYSMAIFNIVTSLVVITLPIPVLLKLKHQRPEIKQLIALILLGLLHTSLTVARFVVMFFPDPWIKTEPQYGWVPAQTLAVCEMQANILFASLVVMRPAFQAIFHVLASWCKGLGKLPNSSDSDSTMDSALGSFRNAREKRNRRRTGESCMLETIASGTIESVVDIEIGVSMSNSKTTLIAGTAMKHGRPC